MRYIALLTALACAQTIIWQENFNSTPAGGTPTGWSLNTTDISGANPPYNRWVVDAPYSNPYFTTSADPAFCLISTGCQTIPTPPTPPVPTPNQPAAVTGSPQSSFLYIAFNPSWNGSPCTGHPRPYVYLAPTTIFPCYPAQSAFARTPSISIGPGTSPVKVSFFWICQADPGHSYGEVYYSTNSGATWNVLTSRSGNNRFEGQSNWYADTITLPITRPANVILGFRFRNAANVNGAEPPFGIDELRVFEESTTSPTITLTSVTPSPVCVGNQLTVSFTHSGFSGSPSFQAQLLDAGNNVVFTSAASTTSPITFTVPASLASGNYSVRVVSGSTQSATQPIQVINLTSFTCSANVTSVVAGNPVTFTLNGGTGFPTSGSLGVTFDPGDASGTSNLGPYTLPGGLPANYSHTYTTPGTYVAQFTASMGGCTHTCQQTITVTAAPTLTLDNLSHTQVCAGGSVQVSYTAAGFPPGTQYTAQLLSGSTVIASASGASPITLTVPPTTPTGTYTVRVQANTNPPTNSNTLTLDVLNLSAFTLTCSANPTTANAGTSITLTANLTPAPPLPVTVQVNPGDGSAVQSAGPTTTFPQSFTHTYTLGGTYTVTFTVSNPAPGCTLTCTQTVTINPTITLGSVTSSVCAGSSLSVPFTAAGFPPATSFTAQLLNSSNAVVASGTGTSSPISISIPTTLPSGTYTVRVVSGSTQSGTASVSVVNLSGFTCSASATTIQAGQTITFTLDGTNLPGSGTLTGTFDPGDGSGIQNLNYTLPGGLPATVSHIYGTPGSFTATFTVSYGGCTQTCQQTITVNPPAGPQLIIGAVASPVCAGGGITVPFQAVGFPANTTYTVEIAPAGSGSWTSLCSGTASPIACLIDPQIAGGTYNIRISGGTPTVYSNEVTIEIIQMSGLTCSLSPSPIYAGEVVTLTLSGSGLPGGPFSVEWAPGANLPLQTQTAAAFPATLTYTYSAPGIYDGRVTVIHTASGCRGRCELPVVVTTRPSGGGGPTSLVFVSPDGSTLVVQGVSRAEIFDALGRTVYVGEGNQPIPVVRGSLYFLRLWVGDRVEVQRLYLP